MAFPAAAWTGWRDWLYGLVGCPWCPSMSGPDRDRYTLVRDDGGDDAFTRQCFACYDEAYDVLERYYGDLCCSDERVYYRIVPLPTQQG